MSEIMLQANLLMGERIISKHRLPPRVSSEKLVPLPDVVASMQWTDVKVATAWTASRIVAVSATTKPWNNDTSVQNLPDLERRLERRLLNDEPHIGVGVAEDKEPVLRGGIVPLLHAPSPRRVHRPLQELLGPVLLRVIPEDPVVVDEDAVGAGGAPGKDAPCKLVEERFPAGPGVLREGEDAEGTHAERAEGPIDRLLLPKRPTPPLHANDVHRERRALVGGAEVHEAAVSPPLHVVLDHQICPLLLRQPRELGHGVAKEMQICVHEQPSEALLHDPQQDVRLDLDDLREPSCSPADGGSL
mmetsp:Transcript_22583/g.50873  ORF Transcript_22583/g.50873 Transcript_22583/m.50873 type:complete len:302 (-) Transcript_22583:45-950(-)